uniref:P0 protein n=1 Tax=Pepper vein yellows virus 10 TaxID=3073889 RepID=A0AA51UCV6_9VIRU|nr:P0 protein [Pepper vein yellows virus 10]
MNFELTNGSYLKVSVTRNLTHKERLLNVAIFLSQYVNLFQQNVTSKNLLCSICSLLPYLLCSRDPFQPWGPPLYHGRKEHKRASRLALYCGAAVAPYIRGSAAATISLQTQRNIEGARSRVQRDSTSVMAHNLERLQTPLFQGAAQFGKFLRVWTSHCEGVAKRSFKRLIVGRNIHMELVNLGHVLLDLLSGHNIHDARRLHRLALCFHNIYGESFSLDVIRLAHLPRKMHIQSGENYLHGSQIQKELC